MDGVIAPYLAVAVVGLIHGLEPGHGWPVAALLSLRRPRPFSYGFAAGTILSSAHFVSSLAVLAAYHVMRGFVDFTSPYFRYLVAAVLFILGARFLTEKSEGKNSTSTSFREEPREVGGLRSLAAFALVLGFAHEEEFMLLALAVGGVDPLVLMLSYATAVTLSLVSVTLLAVRAYRMIEGRIRGQERYLPKVTGIVLVVLASLFILGVY